MHHVHASRHLAASTLLLAALAAAPARAQGGGPTHLGSDAALDALMPQPAVVGEARIGDRLGASQKELKLGATLATASAKANLGWTNGATVPFRLTYDGFGQVSLSVAGEMLAFASQGPFQALALRAYARKDGSSVRVDGLALNVTALGETVLASASGGNAGLDVLLLQLAAPQAGFVLKGDLTLSWSGTPPKGSDLALELRAGVLAEMGRDYCAATVHSGGQACDLSWSGTTSLSASDLVLHASGGIPGGYCLFLAGGSPQAVPFGNGWLCVGPPLARFEPPLSFDAAGAVSLPVDYGVEPLGAGPLAVGPGDARYLQVWYRDPLGVPSSYNFSDALELTFLP